MNVVEVSLLFVFGCLAVVVLAFTPPKITPRIEAEREAPSAEWNRLAEAMFPPMPVTLGESAPLVLVDPAQDPGETLVTIIGREWDDTGMLVDPEEVRVISIDEGAFSRYDICIRFPEPRPEVEMRDGYECYLATEVEP